ncbi:hypothetical protein M413DRAFT_286024 [Hebeloma cylindrosporum]|uniref:DUF6535 domain-containing protein n=1 Tax=Hebeloma cylindrosporum TaxID=76867 RepID=A0A0C2Y6I3_HEBCY|nr:hypothetical protein M413DRAFT_286024 [Hebeloma cylindrosporum h7]
MTILQPIQKDDQEQCEAWNKEVQNILIFAALFSAVVTPFVIESYPLLQTGNQNDATNAKGPLSSSIRINIFWFLSLVLSLTTALMGIITAQWLREHLSYPERLTPEQTFAILNMKTSMLKKWRVRGIISSLSVLLQISVLLFFAGLIQFLIPLEVDAVTIPVIALVGLSGLFPIVTTVLPALHIYIWQKETIVGGDVPVPCPYKSPQAEWFYAFFIFLSSHRPFPQLFSLIYGALMFIPAVLVTIAVIGNFCLRCIFFPEGNRATLGTVLAGLVGKLASLFFKVIEGLSMAADTLLRYLYEVRIRVHGMVPIHYDRTMALIQLAMKEDSDYWSAFDVAWVSIRRDYAFRLYAFRAWGRNINADRHYIMQEWERGENDPRLVWGQAISREENARAGPPWDQIQGLILLRRQFQHNNSNLSVMESSLRCFKGSVSSFRGYDKASNSRPEVNSWMTHFEDATTQILRPHVKEEVTFANFTHLNNRGPGVTLCTASVYHEALFHFIGTFHLEKLADKGELRLKTAWVEIYYKLVRCLPSSEVLQHISVPFAFATCSKSVSSVTFRFTHEEETGDLHGKSQALCAPLR